MEYVYNDGGRSKYFKGNTGDCVTRAIAIATGKDYLEVYNAINGISKGERKRKNERRKSNARKGVYHHTYEKYLKDLGWRYVDCNKPNKYIHLTDSEIPKGTVICRLYKHLVCVIDGVINDTYDCSKKGTKFNNEVLDRRIKGYFYKEG